MMPDIYELLREFMRTPAPSGYEREMAYLLRDKLSAYCDEVSIDNVGNVIGLVRGTGGNRRTMLFAHMDQLGFIVRKIEPDGFIQVDRLGGVPEKVLPGLNLLVRSEDGAWRPGVFCVKSHHATPADEKYTVEPITSMFVDMGADSADEVRAMGIENGCPAVYAPSYTSLANGRVSGTSVDNRGGCAALVLIAALLREARPLCDTYIVGTVWEEFNLRGAMMAARTVKPDVAVSMDVTLAGDTKDLSRRFDDALGKGPCVQLYSFHGRGTLNGTLPHEPLYHHVLNAANAVGVPVQRFATLGMLTDAAYLQLEGDGTACLETGFPARYTHTPVEVCDPRDIVNLSRALAEAARTLTDAFPLHRY